MISTIAKRLCKISNMPKFNFSSKTINIQFKLIEEEFSKLDNK